MSTRIFYFSGTGNSLFVARKLAERLPDSQITSMVSTCKSGPAEVDADVVGLVFPVHAFSLPTLVRRFVSSLSFKSNPYVFAAATRGGSCCRLFEELDGALRGRGARLQGFSFIDMPNNYLTLFGIPSDGEIRRLTEEAQARIGQMAEAVRSRVQYRPEDPHESFAEKNILFPLLGSLHKATKFFNYGNRFYADPACDGCGVCGKVCLSDRITMRGGRPEWDRNAECLMCFACIHACPRRAVQLKGTKTPGLERYRHPDVTVANIMEEKR